MVHIPGGINVDQRPDARDDHQHDHRQLVDREIPADMEVSTGYPGKVVGVQLVRTPVTRWAYHKGDPKEGCENAPNGHRIDGQLRQFLA